MAIHPTAIVHKKAKLADDVEVGPYAVIEPYASIGRGTKIGPHCFIGPFTKIGRDNEIFTGAVIGSVSQDLKFKGERTWLEIGNGNRIREYVTMNRSSVRDRRTAVGSDNLIMAYAHVAHDCVIGDGVIIANCGTLAGYVTVEDRAIIGGLSGVHQFVRIGRHAIIGGCSKAAQDIPPYCMADGHPAKVRGINALGLKRAGFSAGEIRAIRKAVNILCFSRRAFPNAVKEIKKEIGFSESIKYLINFVKTSRRGISR